MRMLIRHIREAVIGMIRHFVMTLSAASAVGVTLMLVAIILVVGATLTNITSNIQQHVQIHVKIDDAAGPGDISSLKNAVAKIDGVLDLTFSSKDEELEKFIASYGETYAMYRGVNNPMKHAIYATVKDGSQLESVDQQIRQLKFVVATNYGGLNTVKMMKAMLMVNQGVFVFVGILGFLSIFLISNTIKLSIHSRHQEISIMRHVGATNGFIRTPFLLEGMLIGLFGSLLPVLLVIFGYYYLYQVLEGQIFTALLKLTPPYPLVLNITIGLLALGMGVGLIGSLLSVNKYLRFNR